MMECSICLSPIVHQQEEAFLNLCWHRYHHKCISSWTQAQLQATQPPPHPPPSLPHPFNLDIPRGLSHPPPAPHLLHLTSFSHHQAASVEQRGRPPLTCPLCRGRYTAVIHDCFDKAFQYSVVDPTGPSHPQLSKTTFVMTPAQRRRRSLYFQEGLPQSLQHARLQESQQQQRQEQHGRGQQQGQQQEQQEEQQLEREEQKQKQQRQRKAHLPHSHLAPSLGYNAQKESKQASTGKPLFHFTSSAWLKPKRRLDDPSVRAWLERELQALLLQEDTAVPLAVALGALPKHPHPRVASTRGVAQSMQMRLLRPSPTPKKGLSCQGTQTGVAGDLGKAKPPVGLDSGRSELGERERKIGDCVADGGQGGLQGRKRQLEGDIDDDLVESGADEGGARFVRAMSPFCGHGMSEQLWTQLGLFVSSGLSVAAYDAAVFERCSKKQNKEQSGGEGKEEQGGEGEEEQEGERGEEQEGVEEDEAQQETGKKGRAGGRKVGDTGGLRVSERGLQGRRSDIESISEVAREEGPGKGRLQGEMEIGDKGRRWQKGLETSKGGREVGGGNGQGLALSGAMGYEQGEVMLDGPLDVVSEREDESRAEAGGGRLIVDLCSKSESGACGDEIGD